MKIAVCTSDGVSVDLHFGKTETFFIYDFTDDRKKFISRRTVSKLSPEDALPEPGKLDHPFEQEKLNQILETLNDCKILYTNAIGEKPKSVLKSSGMEVEICRCTVDNISFANKN